MRTGVDLHKIKQNRTPSLSEWQKIARHGEKHSRDALRLAGDLRHAFLLRHLISLGEIPDQQKNFAEGHIKRAFEALEFHLKNGLRTKSGEFFRDFADAIEFKPKNAAADYIAGRLDVCRECGDPVPTAPQMLRLLKANGIRSNIPSVWKYYQLFDVVPSRADRRRPKGKRKFRTKSPHRAKK